MQVGCFKMPYCTMICWRNVQEDQMAPFYEKLTIIIFFFDRPLLVLPPLPGTIKVSFKGCHITCSHACPHPSFAGGGGITMPLSCGSMKASTTGSDPEYTSLTARVRTE